MRVALSAALPARRPTTTPSFDRLFVRAAVDRQCGAVSLVVQFQDKHILPLVLGQDHVLPGGPAIR
jgi:hypothetical protein